MPRVRNDTGRAIPLLRWTIAPDGWVLDPHGVVKDGLPDDIAYSPQAKRLADKKFIAIHGYVVDGQEPITADPAQAPAPEPVAQQSEDPVQVQVALLTDLKHIGAARSRELTEMGIGSIADLVEVGVEGLSNILTVDESVAKEIIEDAKSKL